MSGNPFNSSLCGCFFLVSGQHYGAVRKYLPQVGLSSHTTIFSTTSRTKLTQTFLNPSKVDKLDQVRYMFPLYDGVSVVGFKYTVDGRVIEGEVKEKEQARKDFKEATERGETAGLLEQCPDAADCFTTSIGNVPAGDKVVVEITYLGELKVDAETDGVRFTIPTTIAPRYGTQVGSDGLPDSKTAADQHGINFVVDIAVEDGVNIRGVQSPFHPIALSMGRTSTMPEDAFDNQHASVSLSQDSAELGQDFVVVVALKGHDTPRAVLEHHPTIPNQRALMATLVPKFNLPQEHPEIVFVADRSGSMGGKIPTLVSALKIFLKSLPVGIKFNICSFGSSYSYLWPKSKIYDDSSLSAALKHVETFDADFGGTEMLKPIKDIVKNRFKDLNLDVIVVTDGEIWNQEELFSFINTTTTKNVRYFSLGIGSGASSSLVEGIARAGSGFAQFVGENEKMEKRVVKMLKGALTPHINDYTMEVKYDKEDDEFEIVESVTESLKVMSTSPSQSPVLKVKQKVFSLFDTTTKVEDTVNKDGGKYDHLPAIDVPKLLQAPHKIPSLFPFSRTTVYVLMSPDSCQHQPTSVVLRATYKHGPLELEIPVQDNGVGQSMHQLAAKKAVQDLEEGRGWLLSAQDKNGKSIKAKHEGRWEEMVEREAVRLGVQYQVGGKWCSFVAVEKKRVDDKSHGDLPDYEMVESADKESEKKRECSLPFPAPAPRYFGAAAGKPSPFGSSNPFGAAASQVNRQDGRSQPFSQAAMSSSFGPAAGFGGGQAPVGWGVPSSRAAPSPKRRMLASMALPARGGSPGTPLPSSAEISGQLTSSSASHASWSLQAQPTGALFGSAAAPIQQQNQSLMAFGPPVADGAQAIRSSGSEVKKSKKSSPSAAGYGYAKSSAPPPPPGMMAPYVVADRAACSLSLGMDDSEGGSGLPASRRRARKAAPVLDECKKEADDAYKMEREEALPCEVSEEEEEEEDDDKMHQLIGLQSFDGSWKNSDELVVLLGLQDKQAQLQAAFDGVSGLQGTDISVVITTVCAVAWLETKAKDEAEVWEMVVDKARGWVVSKLGENVAEAQIEKVLQII